MTDMTAAPRVGDVVTSPHFVYGRWPYAGRSGSDAALSVGYPPGRANAVDEARATRRYVVTDVVAGGVGSEHGGGVNYSGREYLAQALTPEGAFDPHGERIRFTTEAGFTNQIEAVAVVGRMRRLFVWKDSPA